MSPTTAAAPSVAPFLCPRCGGELSVREGARIGRCRYCDTSLLARGLLRYALPPTIGLRGASTSVRRLLRGPESPPDLARTAVRGATELFFVPYWRFQSTVVGRLRGTRTVRRRVREPASDVESLRLLSGAREEIRRESVDRPIREIWRATLSACPVDDLGVPTLTPRRQRSGGMLITRGLDGLPGLRYFDASLFEQGTVLDVMLPLDRAREDADLLYRRFVESRGFELSGRSIRVLQLQQRCYLLYYPVYRVRFRYGGRTFSVTLDGLQGNVLFSHLPVEARGTLMALLGAGFLGAAAAAVPLRLALSPPEGLAGLASSPRLWAAAGLTAAVLVAAGRAATAALRLERERVLHS